MIPYFYFPSFHLGPLTIHVWGLTVALGFGIGLLIAWREARRKNLNPQPLLDLAVWMMIASLFFSRLFYVLFGGEVGVFLAKPWRFLAFWQGGMAATGGFAGVALVLLVFYLKYCRQRHPEERSDEGSKFFWQYVENLAYAFPFGWLIGRLGCFLIHDHPGRLTNSFLGVNFPDGARFDLGLLEMLAILPLAVIFLVRSAAFRPRESGVISRPEGRAPVYSLCLLFWYGLTRFFLDFLRATDLPNSDLRFWSLTLGQWGSVGLVIIGACLVIKKTRRR